MKGHLKTVAIGLAISALALYIYNRSPRVKSLLGG